MNSEMLTEAPPTRSELTGRILVNAPTGSDAGLIAEVLGSRGFAVILVPDVNSLDKEWMAGVGALLIASETLNDPAYSTTLRRLIDAQEPWSEIPVMILGGPGEDEALEVKEVLGDRAQVLILERPLGIATLISAVDAGIRSRARQYQVKRLLKELADSAVRVREAHEEADRTKDEFLATLAHELRSPMTAIRGWVEMLKAGDMDPIQSADALSMIESSTTVQTHIVEDLMDVSRIMAGKVMIEREVIDLAPLVRKVTATFLPAALSEGIELTEEVAQVPVFVSGDGTRLQQVGWNLLSNAIKFTPRGGGVRVSLTRDQNFATFSVRDTGRGISPDLIPHVFERYRQEEGANGKRPHRGLGLGLAIVRHLVEGHGGNIIATSDGLGHGAEFVVVLPLAENASSEA